MICRNPGCISQCDYQSVAYYARRRYLEGIATVVLLREARNKDEKRMIVMASLLDVDDDTMRELMKGCDRGCLCRMLDMRTRLRFMLHQERNRVPVCHAQPAVKRTPII